MTRQMMLMTIRAIQATSEPQIEDEIIRRLHRLRRFRFAAPLQRKTNENAIPPEDVLAHRQYSTLRSNLRNLRNLRI